MSKDHFVSPVNVISELHLSATVLSVSASKELWSHVEFSQNNESLSAFLVHCNSDYTNIVYGFHKPGLVLKWSMDHESEGKWSNCTEAQNVLYYSVYLFLFCFFIHRFVQRHFNQLPENFDEKTLWPKYQSMINYCCYFYHNSASARQWRQFLFTCHGWVVPVEWRNVATKPFNTSHYRTSVICWQF